MDINYLIDTVVPNFELRNTCDLADEMENIRVEVATFCGCDTSAVMI